MQVFPGRSLRPAWPESPAPGFFCHLAKVWRGTGYPSGVPPEGPRSLREAGVSGPADRSLRPGPRPRQVSAPVRSFRPSRSLRYNSPESPAFLKRAKRGELRVPCPEEHRKETGLSGLPRSVRPSQAGVSGISDRQRLVFAEGYKYPSTYLRPASSTSIL